MGRIANWLSRHPVSAIVLVSLLAVVINCYPVIFCGKSYVSPTSVIAMVYEWWPPLPGMDPRTRSIGATAWKRYRSNVI